MARIAFLYDRFHPQIGGIERKIAELSAALAPAHRVYILARATPRLRGISMAHRRVTVIRACPGHRVVERVLRRIDLVFGFGFTPYSARSLFPLLLARRALKLGASIAWCPTAYPIDPGEGASSTAPLWKRLLGRRIRRTLKSRMERAYLEVFRQATALFALRGPERDRWRQLCPDVPVRHIPDGVSVGHRSCVEGRAARERVRGLFGPGPAILCVGRMTRMKNQGLLLDAMPAVRRRFPDAHLILVGPDGEGTGPALRRRAERTGDGRAVTFTGTLPDVDLCWLYAGVDCVVHPSRHEASGLVPLEALAHGTPVIHSGQAGLARLSDLPGCRVVRNTEDPTAWATAIQDLIADREVAQREAKRGRTVVFRRYTWEPLVRAISGEAEAARRVDAGVGAHA